MSELPSYPADAAEREAAGGPPGTRHDYAGWGQRVGAYLLDLLIIVVPLVVLVVAAIVIGGTDAESPAWVVGGLAYLAWIVAPFAYFAVFHGHSGQTPGKRALRIRVVDDAMGRPIGYGRAFGRYAIMFVFGLFFVPALLDYVWPLWDTRKQALHDKIVSSVVVKA